MSNLSTASNNLYELYVKATTDLAQSLVVKFDALAKGVNTDVLMKTGVLANEADPASWKYYQNICGHYHFSDKPMEVYSLDSENIIPFTVAALALNPVTRDAYKFGSTYYNDLLAAFPDQEMLILGILYPANLEQAIAAKDGTILAYPHHLVEPSETDFMRLLQTWLYAYIHRWFNPTYTLTDDLYMATFLAQLTLHLVGMITNIRLAACKTNQAHSFHIKQYLRSHGFLDNYMDQMTRKQALDMYRNINYYERNAGFESTFDQLVEIVLTEAGLPAYAYEMQHNQESLRHDTISDREHLHSVAHFKRLPLNKFGRRFALPTYTLRQVHAIAADQTPYNGAYQDEHEGEIAQRLALSPHANLPTKVVECAINPISTPTSQTPDSILFNHWIDWAASSRYAVPVEYIPEGSEQPVRLTHQQAVAMWVYATHKAREPENDPSYPTLTRVPSLQVQRVTRTPKPPLSDLQSMVTTKVWPANLIELIYGTGVTVPDDIDSLVKFQNVCGQIYLANMRQFNLYSFQQHPIARGHAQGAATRLYEDKVVRLGLLADPDHPEMGLEYSVLIQQLGLNFAGYRPVDYYNTAIRILNAATGSNLNDLLDPSNVQKAMMSLMRYLSSYSVQIVGSGNAETTIAVPRPDVRVSDYQAVESENFVVDMKYTNVLGMPLSPGFHAEISMSHFPSGTIALNQPSFAAQHSFNALRKNGYEDINHPTFPIQWGIDVGYSHDPDDLFWALSPEQRNTVVDVYRK